MVVSVDIGDSLDIHPKNKVEFAERLVLQAQEKVYHKIVVSDGPLPLSYQIINNSIVIKFSSTGKLKSKSNTILTGFEIAGIDNKYYSATAIIKNDELILSSQNVTKPIAARYAWDNNPRCSLYNNEGLPVAPFSTFSLKQILF
jgi:sialate O-acetylesterase|tara:strand:+ start:7263 stop:7694 length:432 start_codon:yes stop_codon:yes gene_type:complete